MSEDGTNLLARIGDDDHGERGSGHAPGQAFATALRGYDKAQVDAYVDAVDAEVTRLHELVSGLDERIRRQDAEHRVEIERLRRQHAEAAEDVSYEGLGERIGLILRLAEEEAQELRSTAAAEAERVRAEIDERVRTQVAEAERVARDRIDRIRAEAERDRAEAAAQRRAAAEEAGRSAEAIREREAQAAERIAADEQRAADTVAAAQQRAAALVAEAERTAALRTGDAEAAAAAQVQDAGRRAASLIADAELRASDILDDVRARARQEEDAARARLDSLDREHRDLLRRLADIRDALAGLTGRPVPPSAAESAAVAAVEEHER